MSLAGALFGKLYATRLQTDTELKLQLLSERRMALLDESRLVSAELTNTIFQTGQYPPANFNMPDFTQQAGTPETSGSPVLGNLLRGIGGFFGENTSNQQASQAKALQLEYYEQKLNMLHEKDKAIATQMKNLETHLRIVKEMKENFIKLSKDNAKKSFTIG